jgi:predicted dehydrogenase
MAVDTREDRLDHIRKTYPGLPVSRTLTSVLDNDEINGVIIATPMSSHFRLARAALMAGKHVLVEKPLATTSEDCHKLIEIAEKRNLVLMVGHTFEYHPAVSFIRHLIRRGDLGRLYYISSRRLNLGLYQADSNVLWDLAPHDLSIDFFLLREEMKSISAWGCAHILPGIEDVVHAKLEFADGVTAHLHVSWLDPVKVRQVTVVGSEGMLIFDDALPQGKVRIYDKQFKPTVSGDSYIDFELAYRHGDVYIPTIPDREPLKLELLDFGRSIATGGQPRSNGRSGLRVVEALEAASASLRREHDRGVILPDPARVAREAAPRHRSEASRDNYAAIE